VTGAPAEPESGPADHLGVTVRTLRIIVGALLFGALAFAGVVLFLQSAVGGNLRGGWLLTLMAAVFALIAIPVRFVYPEWLARANVARVARGESPIPERPPEYAGIVWQLLAIYQTRTIIAAALLEGATFFNLIAYLWEGQWPSLAVAGVLMLLMAALFPTRNRLLAWIEAQQERFGDPSSA
jgi:hypothetical protein